MNNNNNSKKQKLVNILSIACRAGKILSGDFVIEKTFTGKHNIKLLLVADDSAEATKAKYEKLVKTNNDNKRNSEVLLRETELTKDELAACIGKTDRAAVAVCDEGFCKAILKILDN